MPKTGKIIIFDGQSYKVLKHNVLDETIDVVAQDDPEKKLTLTREEWQRAKLKDTAKERQPSPQKAKPKKKKNAPAGEEE